MPVQRASEIALKTYTATGDLDIHSCSP